MWTRWSWALARPRTALAAALEPRAAGRASSDLLALLLLVVIATRLGGLITAGWIAVRVDPTLGLRAMLDVFSLTLALPLGVVAITMAIIWLGAGKARALGRAFDAACVAVVPFAVVALGASVAAELAMREVPRELAWALTGIALLWTSVVVALAIREMRVAQPHPPAQASFVRWLVMALLAAGVVIQGVHIVGDLDTVRPVDNGAKAPAIALPTIEHGGALGHSVSLTALRGRPVIVDFWATWCGPCVRALPGLDAFAKRHPEVTVLAVALDEPGEASALFEQRGYTPTLVLDDGATSRRYGVDTVPHTVVVDREGFIRRVAPGGLDLDAELARLH